MLESLNEKHLRIYRWRRYLAVVGAILVSWIAIDIVGRVAWYRYLVKLESRYGFDFGAPMTDAFFYDEGLVSVLNHDWDALRSRIEKLNKSSGRALAEEIRIKETGIITTLIPDLREAIKIPPPITFPGDPVIDQYDKLWWQFYDLWYERCCSLMRKGDLDELVDALETGLPISRRFAFSDYRMEGERNDFQINLDLISLGLSRRGERRGWSLSQLNAIEEIISDVDFFEDVERTFLLKVLEVDRSRTSRRSHGVRKFVDVWTKRYWSLNVKLESIEMQRGLVQSVAPGGLLDLINILIFEKHRISILEMMRSDHLTAIKNAETRSKTRKQWIELAPHNWFLDIRRVHGLQMQMEAARLQISLEIFYLNHDRYPEGIDGLGSDNPFHPALIYERYRAPGRYRIYSNDPKHPGEIIRYTYYEDL